MNLLPLPPRKPGVRESRQRLVLSSHFVLERNLRGIPYPSQATDEQRGEVLARVAAKDVQRLGTVIEFEDRGYTKYKTNPAVDIMNKAQAAYEATAIKLGLTPTGRKRLRGEEKAKTASEAWDEQED